MSAFQIIPNQVLLQQKRFRGKINIQRPRKPHFQRLLVDTFLTPYYESPKKDKTLADLCFNVTRQRIEEKKDNPYQRIIAREARNWFDTSRMIAIFHKNSFAREDEFELAVPLKRNNMYLKTYGRETMLIALENSPYMAIEPLLSVHYMFVFSPDTNVTALQKIVRKFPQVVLMAGILEGRLLSYDDFVKYGKMDLTTARVNLVQALQSASSATVQHLTYHQSTLVSRLKQIAENAEEKK